MILLQIAIIWRHLRHFSNRRYRNSKISV